MCYEVAVEMCGIAGVFSTSSGPVDQSQQNVAKMVRILAHRGPDDNGLWSAPSGFIVMGHCRLSILDLSQEGRQPMVSSCGRYVISFNGEIYNYVELKEILRKSGVQFRGNSDTEVLLEAIVAWGMTETLNKLVGMFAFALWDKSEQKLILARDRAGKKPLYYLKTRESLCFASELKALKAAGGIDFELDEDALYQYLTFGYIPAPKTIYKDVFKIPAGHYMTVDKKLDQVLQPYWKAAWGEKIVISFDDAVDEADRLLKEAVKIRLRADVPVGCFLSGGIDSGLLAAISSNEMGKSLKTFTVSFQDGSFDESSLADLVAKRYKTDHHVFALSPNLKEILPQVVRAYDEPFADPSAIPSYCISQEARKYLKVVLNGEGGDELFGGYRRHLAVKCYNLFGSYFNLLPEKFYRKLGKILPQPKVFRSKYAFLHRFVRGIVRDPFERYIAWCADGFGEVEKESLYSHLGQQGSSIQFLSQRYQAISHINTLDHFMAIDFLFNMHNDMLVKMDIATMSHGLEGRNPFLDHRLIEWATALPPEIRMKGFKTKPILRKLSERYLPEAIVSAPKRGFEIPLIQWLRKDLFDMVYSTCLSPNGIVMDLFDKKYVESLLLEKQKLDSDRWSKRVWILFMLAMWNESTK